MNAILETDITIKDQQEGTVLLHRCDLSEPMRFSVKTLSKTKFRKIVSKTRRP